MPQFVQVLGPAADGQGMTLNSKKLHQMLCAEAVKGLPVGVLAAVGPRGSGKTTLLSAVQRNISGGSTAMVAGVEPRPQSTGMDPKMPSAGTDPRMPWNRTDEMVPPDGMDPRIQPAEVDPGMLSTGMDPRIPSTGMDPRMSSIGMELGTRSASVGLETQPGGMTLPPLSLGMGPMVQSAGLRPKTQSPGTEEKMQWTAAESGIAPARTACEADRPGSAGAAVWSELLPVTLPSGERAVLLLMDTWGPFDDRCPEQQRNAVLLFSALISSTLVVMQTSAGGPVCPLGDLALLAKLGAAAQDVRHCTPLQELILLMRDWSGPAPHGRQIDFRPLYAWAESEQTARQALTMMMDAADWYNEGAAFLFLAPSQDAKVAPADPVSLLTTSRSAKRFDEVDIPAGELADYLERLAATLAMPSCDAASLLHALIEANQRVAARAAMPFYEQRMKQLASQWQMGPLSEQELRGAHNRAAHDVLMSFTMSKKMDSENTDTEKLKGELQQWLEEQYDSKREAIRTDAEKLENEAIEQRSHCKELYENSMQRALKESPQMTMAELIKNHEKFRLEVLSMFDQGSRRHSQTQQRMDLSDDLEASFREIANKLDQTKEEAEAAEAEKSIVSSAEKSAEKLYRDILEAVKPDKLSMIHRRVQECAELQFDSKTKNLSEEHKSAARERLVARNKATLQSLLDQAQRDAARISSHAEGVNTRAIGHPGFGYDGHTAVMGHGSYGGQRSGCSSGATYDRPGPGYAADWQQPTGSAVSSWDQRGSLGRDVGSTKPGMMSRLKFW